MERVGFPFSFTGEMVDANDLVYLRARYYHPGLGVFTGLDPVESFNRYQYVGANPTNFVDPSGLYKSYAELSQHDPCYQRNDLSDCLKCWTDWETARKRPSYSVLDLDYYTLIRDNCLLEHGCPRECYAGYSNCQSYHHLPSIPRSSEISPSQTACSLDDIVNQSAEALSGNATAGFKGSVSSITLAGISVGTYIMFDMTDSSHWRLFFETAIGIGMSYDASSNLVGSTATLDEFSGPGITVAASFGSWSLDIGFSAFGCNVTVGSPYTFQNIVDIYLKPFTLIAMDPMGSPLQAALTIGWVFPIYDSIDGWIFTDYIQNELVQQINALFEPVIDSIGTGLDPNTYVPTIGMEHQGGGVVTPTVNSPLLDVAEAFKCIFGGC